jgi:endogenous inhibitor of DNA gyrase (YacG/DUF329 family)
VTCPICHKPVDDGALGQPGSTFPFCSERCRLIDLGRWLSGKYQIRASKDEAEASDWDASSAPPTPDDASRRGRRARRDAGDA